jgi:hypothetical protein
MRAAVLISLSNINQYVVAKEAGMIDWTMLSPTFLAAVAEWAGAVVTVLAAGSDRSATEIQTREKR